MKHKPKLPYFIAVGLEYGYPLCCCEEFELDNKERGKSTSGRKNIIIDNLQNCSGFIPCFKHRQDIIFGRATLSSLITDTRATIHGKFHEVWDPV